MDDETPAGLVTSNIPEFSNPTINQRDEDQDSKIAKLNHALRVQVFGESESVEISTAVGVALTTRAENQWQKKRRVEAN